MGGHRGIGAGACWVLDDEKELVEDVELEFQFDAVDNSFVSRLDVEVVGEFGDEETGIHGYNNEVDEDQMTNDLPLSRALEL